MTTLQEAAQQLLDARDRFGWSVEVDDYFHKLRDVLASEPQAEPAEHRQGCDALGGYGQGVGPCSCGAEQPGSVRLSDEQIDTLMPIGEAEVLWFDPRSRFGPEPSGKIIDASMAFMSSAPLGTKLFSREQVRETVRAALAAAQPVAAGWKPIETAPVSGVVRLEVRAADELRVFAAERSLDSESGSWHWLITTGWAGGWQKLHGGWAPTRWMPLPPAATQGAKTP